VAYADAVERMEAERARVLAGGAGVLLLCEHTPVITLGRAARLDHVHVSAEALAARGIALARSSRGGAVTYHGPGQLMVYPVVRLDRGVVAHLERIAAVLAALAAEHGAPGARFLRAPTGLWLGARKLAACGLHVGRGVAIHGFAFDLATPPDAWRAIVPCGLDAAAPISLAEASGRVPPSAAALSAIVAERIAAALGRVQIPLASRYDAPSRRATTSSDASSSSTTPTTTRS
jgi:lipoate-protein ligase B